MHTMLRSSLLTAAVLLCLWTPAAARADINAKDVAGKTELMRAAEHASTAHLKALIAAGADINAKDNNGETALILAALNGYTDCVKALIAAKADVNAKQNNGDTALTLTAGNGNADCVKALIAAKADVNVKDNEGDTALMQAAWKGDAESVKALVAAGADVNAKDNHGRTALTEAAGKSDAVSVKALIAAGANVNVEIFDYCSAEYFVAMLTDLPGKKGFANGGEVGIDCLRAAINEAATQMHWGNVTVEAQSSVLSQQYYVNDVALVSIQGESIHGQIHWKDVKTGEERHTDFTWQTHFPDAVPEDTASIPAKTPIFVPVHYFLREANCAEEDLLKLALNASSSDLRVAAGCVLAETMAPICDQDSHVRAAAVAKLTDRALLAQIVVEDTAHDVRQAAKDRLNDLRK